MLCSNLIVHYSCMKVKRSSSKVNYAAKNAPLFCEIWFINKGKLTWKREASEWSSPLPSSSHVEDESAEILRSESQRYSQRKLAFYPEYLRSSSARNVTCARISNWVQSESICAEVPVLSTISSSDNGCFPHLLQISFSPTSTSSGSGCSFTERRASSDSDSKVEDDSSYSQLAEVGIEAEASKNKALEELLKRKKLEFEAMEAISKVIMT